MPASIQVEGLISLAGIVEMSIKTYPFDPKALLTTLHKLDAVLAALCKGTHPVSGAPLPGSTRPLVTQTQKVRIRSLAENTRHRVFSSLPSDEEEIEEDGEGDGDDSGDGGGTEMERQPWLLEATRVYDRTLMLLAD